MATFHGSRVIRILGTEVGLTLQREGQITKVAQDSGIWLQHTLQMTHSKRDIYRLW